jgi:hypothetical protein
MFIHVCRDSFSLEVINFCDSFFINEPVSQNQVMGNKVQFLSQRKGNNPKYSVLLSQWYT